MVVMNKRLYSVAVLRSATVAQGTGAGGISCNLKRLLWAVSECIVLQAATRKQ